MEIIMAQVKLLLIDDSEHVQKIVSHYLDKDKFTVSIASDGAQGLKMAKTVNPDLILLDLIFPGGQDGLTVLSELKLGKKTKDIPVIVFSVRNMPIDIEEALHRGADDYLTKPFDPKKFENALRRKLKRLRKQMPEKTA